MRLSIILLFSLYTINSHAQSEVIPEIDFGLSVPQGDLTSRVYSQGVTYSAGVSVKVWKEFNIKPSFRYRFFKNNFDSKAIESLRVRSLSASISYFFFKEKDIQLKPEFTYGYASFRNLVRFDQKEGKDEVVEMMKGNDSFYEFGLSAHFKKVYLKFTYQWFSKVPDLDQDIVNAVEAPLVGNYQLFYIIENELNLDNYSITIGFSIK